LGLAGEAVDKNGHKVIVGDKVMINCRGRGYLRYGTVMFVRYDGTIDVDYTDGGYKLRIAQYKVFLVGDDISIFKSQSIFKLQPGVRVEVQLIKHGQRKWYPGTIIHTHYWRPFNIIYVIR
jgi:hypothetical protein